MKTNKVIYWIATGLLSAMMIMSAGMYLFNYDAVAEVFSNLGHPTYIIYPLAIAKLLAVIAIVSKKSKFLMEWAYAGLFFDFVLAASAHIMTGHGESTPAFVAIILLMVSRFYYDKVFGETNKENS